MTSMHQKPRKPFAILATILTILMLPLLYVLSIGPCAETCGSRNHHAADDGSVYCPVLFIGERSNRIQGMLTWYADLWVEQPPPRPWPLAMTTSPHKPPFQFSLLTLLVAACCGSRRSELPRIFVSTLPRLKTAGRQSPDRLDRLSDGIDGIRRR